ncbi:hypothetical protein [Chromobacterium violaceum]|uniref:hypothetical protein n=1 Tax=Chromobacterium violaceum TaxID=536 RepID=UPI0012D32BC3|nr:hypothetical protein [Chromobacterium violaceum]
MKNKSENIAAEVENILSLIHEKGRIKKDRLEEEFSQEAIEIAQNNQNVSVLLMQDLANNKNSYCLCSLKPRKDSGWN